MNDRRFQTTILVTFFYEEWPISSLLIDETSPLYHDFLSRLETQGIE